MNSASRGFTLIEVLVALAVFAVLSSGYLIATSNTVGGLSRIQDKAIASWLAQDTMTRLRTLKADEADRFVGETVDYAGRDWRIEYDVIDTDVSSMKRVMVQVALKDDTDSILATLESYFIDGPYVP